MLKRGHVVGQNGLVTGRGASWGEGARAFERDAGMFASGGMAERLLGEDYRQAYVELAITQPKVIKPSQQLPGTAAASGPQRPGAAFSGSSLKEEIPFAVKAYANALACVRRMMGSALRGSLDASYAEEAVLPLIRSLERNPDALLCLPRLRQQEVYTFAHSVNVSVLLAAFALHTGLKQEKVASYALAGLMHDVGKALLPVSLLGARRSLTDEEQTVASRHPMLGCGLLISLPDVCSEVLMAVLEHHERYDGSGYPKGISGDSISEIGHLTAIADTYDALSSRRPYKEALYTHKTLGVMYQLRKKQFHPELMEKFVRMVGIYPVGSVVELKNGCKGVVTANNPANPIQPKVTLILDQNGLSVQAEERDLSSPDEAGVARCLAPVLSGIDPRLVLGMRW